jgi:uncharacterized repeat protein (TIGR01451 family)
MLTTLKRLAFVGMFLLPLAATPLAAQSPTPEGTVIKNKATATFTDANSNTYSAVSDSVSVTVGYLAGPSPTPVSGSATPASPSTADTVLFTLRNVGNGVDTMSVATSMAGAGVTITGYRISLDGGATYNTYATTALLNTAITNYQFVAGATLPVQVIFNVNSTSGGSTIALTLTQTTRRLPTVSANALININPPGTRAVAVTPVGATATQLPTNGTPYSVNFTVTNNGNASDTYNLLAAIAGAGNGAVTITKVNGVTGTTGTVVVASGASATIAVEYTVSSAVLAGVSDKINFSATSQADALIKDTGDLTVTVTKAAVSISKTAWDDLKLTQLTVSSLVKPGDYIQYKIAVANGAAAAPAASVQISDALPAEVTYVSSSSDAAGWTISQSAGTVTATLSGTLAAGATRFIWVRVQIK